MLSMSLSLAVGVCLFSKFKISFLSLSIDISDYCEHTWDLTVLVTSLLGTSYTETFPETSFTNLDMLSTSKTIKHCILRNYIN